jgi:hypothetical protein
MPTPWSTARRGDRYARDSSTVRLVLLRDKVIAWHGAYGPRSCAPHHHRCASPGRVGWLAAEAETPRRSVDHGVPPRAYGAFATPLHRCVEARWRQGTPGLGLLPLVLAWGSSESLALSNHHGIETVASGVMQQRQRLVLEAFIRSGAGVCRAVSSSPLSRFIISAEVVSSNAAKSPHSSLLRRRPPRAGRGRLARRSHEPAFPERARPQLGVYLTGHTHRHDG